MSSPVVVCYRGHGHAVDAVHVRGKHPRVRVKVYVMWCLCLVDGEAAVLDDGVVHSPVVGDSTAGYHLAWTRGNSRRSWEVTCLPNIVRGVD